MVCHITNNVRLSHLKIVCELANNVQSELVVVQKLGNFETTTDRLTHSHNFLLLFYPLDWMKANVFTWVCILEYLLSRSSDICEVAREVILEVATDITDVQREHCHQNGKWGTRLERWEGELKMITWRMEDLERSLLTGLRPGKGCGESFVLDKHLSIKWVALNTFRYCLNIFYRPTQAVNFYAYHKSHLLPARSPGAVACKLLGPQAAKLPPHFESRLNKDILLPLTIPSPPPVFFFLAMISASIFVAFLYTVEVVWQWGEKVAVA